MRKRGTKRARWLTKTPPSHVPETVERWLWLTVAVEESASSSSFAPPCHSHRGRHTSPPGIVHREGEVFRSPPGRTRIGQSKAISSWCSPQFVRFVTLLGDLGRFRFLFDRFLRPNLFCWFGVLPDSLSGRNDLGRLRRNHLGRF